MSTEGPLDLVTVAEAARITGIPAGTIRSWISRQRLHTAGYAPGRTKLYALQHIKAIDATTTRRTR